MRASSAWCALLLVGSASAAPAAVGLVPVATGLSQPTFVTHAGDGSGRLFIVEQPGRIKVLQPGGSTPTVFLDITPIVRSPTSGGGEEEGLLSVAFHPNYFANGFFYVYYTDAATNGDTNIVARYTASPASANVVDPATGTVILRIPHPTNANHNGGQLQFGPDGCLYVSVGDGGAAGDPLRHGQSLGTLLGKLLRLDDTGAPCTHGGNNPFVGLPGALPEIWALGLRNPWRFAFDRGTGDLIVADVGQGAREEIDFQPAGAGGLNYCWSALEGTLPFNADQTCTTGTPTAPILEYGTHDGNRCAITGGYVYRGSAGTFPSGTYVFGDFCSGEIFTLANGLATVLFDTDLLISSFGEDESGELYVADRGTTGSNGRVQRFVGSSAPELQVGLNRLLAYHTGDTLTVGLAVRNAGSPITGDFYLGALLPDGRLAFFTSLSPLGGVLLPGTASPASFPPLLRGVPLGTGAALPMQAVFASTFTGSEPPSSQPGGLMPYVIFAALTAPDAFADGGVDPGDVLLFSSQALIFTP